MSLLCLQLAVNVGIVFLAERAGSAPPKAPGQASLPDAAARFHTAHQIRMLLQLRVERMQVKKARQTPEGALKQMPLVPDLPSRTDEAASLEVKRSMSAANLHKVRGRAHACQLCPCKR